GGGGWGSVRRLGPARRRGRRPRPVRRPAAAARAGVLVDDGLDHEQRRRTVLQLLAVVHAAVDPHLAAAGADALGLGQPVVALLAGAGLGLSSPPLPRPPTAD